MMKIGSVDLASPLVVSPMAGMTDTAFRRLVKRHGGCGLVVTEMVSSEGLVRGIDRTLDFAEHTEEERPVAIQIFVGRGVLRSPWVLAQAQDLLDGRAPREVSLEERGRFLLDYIDLLLHERVDEAEGFRHTAPAADAPAPESSRHDRWV